MKAIILKSLLICSICTLAVYQIKAQPKSYLTSVETSKLFEVTGGTFATNPAENEAMDFTFISNRMDEFLRTEYLKDFPINLVEKARITENESYKSLNSSLISSTKIQNYKGEPLGDGSYKWGYSLADEYVPNQPYAPLMWEDGDLDELKAMFPDSELFMTATVSFFIMQSSLSAPEVSEDNSERVVPKLTLKVIMANNKKFKVLTTTSWYDVPTADKSILFGLEYDLEKQKEVFSKMTDKLIERLRKTKEKDIKKFQKWLDK